MKLSTRDARAFLARPDPARSGALLYGADAMRVALKRKDMLAALLGPSAEEEMRLERIDSAEARRTPSLATDAQKSVGFFAGQRAVLVEDATDGNTPGFATALDDWAPGDAMLVATAGALPARSKLRKLFEGASNAVAIAIYNDPPGRDEIEAELARAHLARPGPEAMADLEALARALDPGDFRQTVEKLGLYKLGDATDLTSADIAACAPLTIDAALDDALAAAATGRQTEIGPLMQRLEGQGVTPVAMVIAASMHFRALHAAACDPKGPAAALARRRPPIFGPRRDAMAAQASRWGRAKLETALTILMDTDLDLRSAAQTAPQAALVERLFIRLAMLAQR
ncbi:MAG: DNA polymerase III subunit delta [Pseudomonadota bacterium]